MVYFHPQVLFLVSNGERYKILKAQVGNGIGKAGEVISDNLEIASHNNKSIKILEIQREEKNLKKSVSLCLVQELKRLYNIKCLDIKY